MTHDSRFWARAGVVCVSVALAWAAGTRLRNVEVAPIGSAMVSTNLPACVRDWVGQGFQYCQNTTCGRSYHDDELNGSSVCPVCGGSLGPIAIGERLLLPADTTIARRSYRNAVGNEIVVSIVLSGNDQRSIHRPQQCLPAQGFAILSTRPARVRIDREKTLDVTEVRAGRGAASLTMVYWFAGGGHETASHFVRLMWMAWDNIVHGVRARWAYVSVQELSSQGTVGEARINEFVAQAYPLITMPMSSRACRGISTHAE